MSYATDAPPHQDRCVGCLLGVACGDVLGAAVEGWSASEIRESFGEMRDFCPSARGIGCYTDDTQMTLALASSLVELGRVDAAHLSRKYAEFYEPWRGYGGGAHVVMQALREGADHRVTGRLVFPEGSYANGGAMRIAPVGLAYRHSPDDVLRKAVEDAIVCTHVHPEAIDGAVVQAKAVALAATMAKPGDLDPTRFLEGLRRLSQTPILDGKLERLSRGIRQGDSDAFVVAMVGNRTRASEAVASALWAFARYGDSTEECIVRAVSFGGDTDTIAAMAGALAGALHGASGIPPRWLDRLENGPRGRDEIVELGRALSRLDVA